MTSSFEWMKGSPGALLWSLNGPALKFYRDRNLGQSPERGDPGEREGGDFQEFEEEKWIRKEEKCPEGGVGNTLPPRIDRRLLLGGTVGGNSPLANPSFRNRSGP